MKTKIFTAKYFIWSGAIFAVYFLAAYYGLKLGAVSGFASLVWAPTGIALAIIILLGYRYWPAIMLAAFAVNFVTGAPLLAALTIGLGNSLEALVGAYLMKKIGEFTYFSRTKDAVNFIVFAAFLATMVSATVGTTSLYLAGVVKSTSYSGVWVAWWVGDALGALLITPAIVVWAKTRRKFEIELGKLIEGVFAVSLLLILSLVIFRNLGSLNSVVNSNPSAYLIFLPMIWIAIRFDKRWAMLSLLATAGIAIWGTANGWGPFVRQNLSSSLLFLQTFTGVLATTAIIIAVSFDEIVSAKEENVALNKALHSQVLVQTNALTEAQETARLGSWEWDVPKNLVTWSKEMYAIYGLDSKNFKASYEGFLERLHPSDRDRVDKLIKEAFNTKKPFDYIHRIVLPNGKVRVLHAKGKVFIDKKGKVIKMIGIGQDITESQAAHNTIVQRSTELEKLNSLMIGREVRIKELKDEIGKLKGKSASTKKL